MTNEERAEKIGDELTGYVAAWIANPQDAEALSNFCAALINRCSAQSASTFLVAYREAMRAHARLDALEQD